MFWGKCGIDREEGKLERIFNGTFLWLLNDFFKYSLLASFGPRNLAAKKSKKVRSLFLETCLFFFGHAIPLFFCFFDFGERQLPSFD